MNRTVTQLQLDILHEALGQCTVGPRSSVMAASSHQCYPVLNVNDGYSTIQVSWLLTLSGRPFQPLQQYDDPNLTCTNILSELREAGFAPASFPPTKLRQGYGDAVCSILNALCDLTLELTNFLFQAPAYLAETYVLVLLPVSCLNSTRPFSSLRKSACSPFMLLTD